MFKKRLLGSMILLGSLCMSSLLYANSLPTSEITAAPRYVAHPCHTGAGHLRCERRNIRKSCGCTTSILYCCCGKTMNTYYLWCSAHELN